MKINFEIILELEPEEKEFLNEILSAISDKLNKRIDKIKPENISEDYKEKLEAGDIVEILSVSEGHFPEVGNTCYISEIHIGRLSKNEILYRVLKIGEQHGSNLFTREELKFIRSGNNKQS